MHLKPLGILIFHFIYLVAIVDDGISHCIFVFRYINFIEYWFNLAASFDLSDVG
jgi:hypothetical protein